MKKQSNHSSAFLNPSLQISLFVFLAGAVLAVFGRGEGDAGARETLFGATGVARYRRLAFAGPCER